MPNNITNVHIGLFLVLLGLIGIALVVAGVHQNPHELSAQVLSADDNLFPTETEISEDQPIPHPALAEKTPVTRPLFTMIPLATDSPFQRGSCPRPDQDHYPAYLARIDRNHSIGDYVPPHLVEIRSHIKTKENRNICLDETTAVHLQQMLDDAKTAGHDISVTSGYRDQGHQAALYRGSVARNGHQPYPSVAKSGHSEHQMGTTVDVTGASIRSESATQRFGKSPEGMWLRDNAHHYGFIMSYPEGAEEQTGYIYEPWHWRFVGENVELFEI